MNKHHDRHNGTASATHSETIDELRHLILEAEQAMANAGDSADEKLVEVKQRLHSALSDGKSVLGRWSKAAAGQVKMADKTVRDHPYQSIGIALGVGALVGYLLSSSKR